MRRYASLVFMNEMGGNGTYSNIRIFDGGGSGSDGNDGMDGEAGNDGSTILSGNGTPSNNIGRDGDFYVDRTNALFFGPKSDGAWSEESIALMGSAGVQGVPGLAGEQGLQGIPGNDGADGPQGLQGDLGPDGSEGPIGSEGPAGAAGTDGSDGTNGTQILSGEGPPDDQIGLDGDYYIDSDTNTLYRPKINGGWNGRLVRLGQADFDTIISAIEMLCVAGEELMRAPDGAIICEAAEFGSECPFDAELARLGLSQPNIDIRFRVTENRDDCLAANFGEETQVEIFASGFISATTFTAELTSAEANACRVTVGCNIPEN